MLQPPGQDHVARPPSGPQGQGGAAHPYLEGDVGLLGTARLTGRCARPALRGARRSTSGSLPARCRSRSRGPQARPLVAVGWFDAPQRLGQVHIAAQIPQSVSTTMTTREERERDGAAVAGRDREGRSRTSPSPGSGCRSRWSGRWPGSRPRRPGSTPSWAAGLRRPSDRRRRRARSRPGSTTTSSRSTCSRPVGHLHQHERQRGHRRLAGDGRPPQRPRQHCQSSNDTIPTAIHLAALDAAVNDLLPALGHAGRGTCSEAQGGRVLATSSRPGGPT